MLRVTQVDGEYTSLYISNRGLAQGDKSGRVTEQACRKADI